MDQLSRPQQLASQFLGTDDPNGWFEALYAESGPDLSGIPWADGKPHPLLTDWLSGIAAQEKVAGRRAVVVGCGTGENAQALARAGYVVTAFDLSPTAIRICKSRFPGSEADYRTEDLFKLPADWANSFDLVVEIYTIQAMPPGMHHAAAGLVAGLVAPGGLLLVIARYGKPDNTEASPLPPHPLDETVLDCFSGQGLQRLNRVEYTQADQPDVPRIFCLYRRPAQAAGLSGSPPV